MSIVNLQRKSSEFEARNSYLYNSRRESSTSDVTFIAAQGLRCRAHQIYLASFIPVIKDQLGKTDHLLVFIPNFTYKTVDSLLRFLYTGEVKCRTTYQAYALLDLIQALGVISPSGSSVEILPVERPKRPSEGGEASKPKRRRQDEKKVHSCIHCDKCKTTDVTEMLTHLTTEHYKEKFARITKQADGTCSRCLELIPDEDFLVHYGVAEQYVLEFLPADYRITLGFPDYDVDANGDMEDASETYPKCPECGEEIYEKEDFLRHQSDQHYKEKFLEAFQRSRGQCNQCLKIFTDADGFRNHLGVEHELIVKLLPEDYQARVVRHMAYMGDMGAVLSASEPSNALEDIFRNE